jgi:hypothetical protein
MNKLFVIVLTAGLIAASPAMASDAMPAAQQNALIQKYCAVCHTDAHLNGGLSLEHFDAAHPDPGVAAMLLSKLTSGLSLEKVRKVESDPDAAAMLAAKMKTGAMGAAGLPVPDRGTQNALVAALSAETAGASAWTVNRRGQVLTAGIAREVRSATNAADADMYRLTLTCDPDTHKGEMLLSWAPGVPAKNRAMSVAVDAGAPVTYTIEPGEKMFTGASGTSGTGAIILSKSKSLPKQNVTVINLFPDETVVFPFMGLDGTVRGALAACFE